MARLNGNEESREIMPAEYEIVPPARSRAPTNLLNKDCGARYRSCGKITRKGLNFLNIFLNTELYVLCTVLCTIYHNRNNTIQKSSSKDTISDKDRKAKIKAIFNCTIYNYRFSVNEIYKRYLIRKGAIRKLDQAEYNFWNLSEKERKKWTDWLVNMGKVKKVNKALWIVRSGKDNKWFLKFTDSTLALAIIQTTNALHDSLVILNKASHSFQAFVKAEREKAGYTGC